MNRYETLTMLEAVNQIMPVHTFLRDAFFPHELDKTYPTEKLEIDFKKGKRNMAPFVAPKVGGVTIEREGYETSQISAPRIAPQRSLTIDDLSLRALGESVISPRTPADREAEILADDFSEMSDMIDRREEWMIRELLFNGKVPVKGYVDANGKNTVDMEINYGKKEKENATWTKTSDILGDLRKWRTEIIQKTGKAPSMLVLASEVVDILLNSDQVGKMFDLKNVNIGSINPVIQNESVTFVGKITSLGLDVYSYDEWYVDEKGNEQPMIPTGHVLMGNRSTGSVKYAVVTQVENKAFKSYEATKVPKIWVDEANDSKMIRLTSRPVPVPFDIESWIVAKVV